MLRAVFRMAHDHVTQTESPELRLFKALQKAHRIEAEREEERPPHALTWDLRDRLAAKGWPTAANASLFPGWTMEKDQDEKLIYAVAILAGNVSADGNSLSVRLLMDDYRKPGHSYNAAAAFILNHLDDLEDAVEALRQDKAAGIARRQNFQP